MNPHTWHMICITCYFLNIGTDIRFNHTNSAIHSSGHSHSLFTSASDYASAQWRLVLHILVTCSPRVNKCWVTFAIYGIRCGLSHWPITIQHVRAQWGSIVSRRACSAGSERTVRVSRSTGDFSNGLKKYLHFFLSLIKKHHLLVCDIINMMLYDGCSQMLHILLKTETSFIAHSWRLLCVVGLEEYSAHDWRAATSVTARSSSLARVGPVVWIDRFCIRNPRCEETRVD